MQQPKLSLASEPTLVKRKDKDTTPSVWNPNWKYQAAGSALDLAEKFKRIRKQHARHASPRSRPSYLTFPNASTKYTDT